MGDFFNRKGLLSEAQRAKIPKPATTAGTAEDRATPPATAHPAIAPPALPVSHADARTPEHEVFQRTTLVPDVPPEAHARELMNALDEAGATSNNNGSPKEVSLSFTSMELAFDENPTALGFVEVQKGRHQSGELAQRDGNATQTQKRQDPQPSANIDELYELGDFSAALEVAEARLERDPEDGVALGYRNTCRDKLLQMLLARLGRLDAKVELRVASDQLRWLSVDHRAGFVISLVDGNATLDEILDVAGMPRLEALRILVDLKERGVIALVR